MGNDSPTPQLSWKRSRYGFAAFWFLTVLAGWSVLRLVLFFSIKPAGLPPAQISATFFSGLHRDVFAGLVATLPLLLWMFIIPNRSWSAKWHRILFIAGSVFFPFLLIFLFFVEFFFFDEFKSRFNTVAVDYLIYPQEVFVNIWQSYHVGLFIALCLLLTVAWLFAAHKLFRPMWDIPFSRKQRFVAALVTL